MTYDRDKYLEAVRSSLETNIFYHSLALEACMGGIYDYLSSQGTLLPSEPSKDDWKLAGLIHDIDYAGQYKDLHPSQTRQALSAHQLNLSDTVFDIVRAHGWHNPGGIKPSTQSQWAIFCADSLTGLIVAVALVYPTKKLADVKLSSILKRFHKEPRFAAGTRRDEVALCQNPDTLNIPLDKFIEICLSSMQSIADNIGL